MCVPIVKHTRSEAQMWGAMGTTWTVRFDAKNRRRGAQNGGALMLKMGRFDSKNGRRALGLKMGAL